MRKSRTPSPPAPEPEPEEHPLRAYRHRNNLTLEQLAGRAETTKATISRIENGTIDPTFALTRRLIVATKFEVTADMLIAWSPASKPATREARAAT